MKNDQFTFLDKREYLRDLINRISKLGKGDRVMIVTLAFDVEEQLVRQLVDVMCGAARKGAEVSLSVDTYVLLVRRKKVGRRIVRTSPKHTLEALSELRRSGGEYAITNRPDRTLNNPFSGRSHIKAAIIGDDVYIGGCNLTDSSNIDMMVRFKNSAVANWLYDHTRNIVVSENTRLTFKGTDQEIDIDDNTRLSIDAGERGQSTIYRNTLELIDNAKEWLVITCQFFPNSETAKHLAAAYKRGVKVTVYYNHPSQHRRPHNVLHHMVVLQEKTRHPKVMFQDQLQKDSPFLHAKLLASEQGAMIGSHNYVSIGVKFGTAEIALRRNDPEFSLKAVEAFTKQLG